MAGTDVYCRVVEGDHHLGGLVRIERQGPNVDFVEEIYGTVPETLTKTHCLFRGLKVVPGSPRPAANGDITWLPSPFVVVDEGRHRYPLPFSHCFFGTYPHFDIELKGLAWID